MSATLSITLTMSVDGKTTTVTRDYSKSDKHKSGSVETFLSTELNQFLDTSTWKFIKTKEPMQVSTEELVEYGDPTPNKFYFPGEVN